MDHTPGFLALVAAVRGQITEIEASALADALRRDPDALLIDVREDGEFAQGHVRGALHLGRGVLERDIETRVPDPARPLFLYCGGGYRSALAADSLQRMGYSRVTSVNGGWRALQTLMPTEP